VADMSSAMQARMLRLLQGGEFERVGGHETIVADVRIIGATNRNLEQMVADGTFRRDLYYRLNGLTISLPALRDRRDDIPLLARHFIARLNLELDRRVVEMTDEVERLFADYDWPGNVRQLQNTVRYALIHAQGDTITRASLPPPFSAATAP